MIQVEERWEEQSSTVSSLRLGCHFSDSLEYIPSKDSSAYNFRKSKGEF